MEPDLEISRSDLPCRAEFYGLRGGALAAFTRRGGANLIVKKILSLGIKDN